MNCRKCNRRPCQCKISTTTTNCSTGYCAPTVVPPAICNPGSNRPTPPKITIEDLLKLIESKCDKETCQLLQYEIGLLYLLLELERPGAIPPGTNPPGNGGGGVVVPPVHHKKFQLIANMVDTLHGGELKDKYPSAQLLKDELLSLWQCMYNKQQHHGDWDKNFTYRDVLKLDGDNKCLTDGGIDPAPDKLKVITPVDVGSTVFNTIDGKRCLFESLVDNNIVEPTKLSVLQGKWMNYCDLKQVIDCVLPRKIITDCKEACDDTNKDGVSEGKTLCERVTVVEDCTICTVVDTNSVDLTKKALAGGIGNSIKADVKIDPNKQNLLSVGPKGLLATTSGLPVGAVTMVNSIDGTIDVPFDDHPDYSALDGNPADKDRWDFYEFGHTSVTLDPSDYEYLKTVGEPLVVTFNASVGYYIKNSKVSAITQIYPYQWGTVLYVDGKRKKTAGDMYSCNRTGESTGLSDNYSLTIHTTGKPLKITTGYVVSNGGDNNGADATRGATFAYDMASFTVFFSAGDNSKLHPVKEPGFTVPKP